MFAFFAALKIGEFVALNRQSNAILRFSDVLVSDDEVQDFIRRSKQFS